jgi:dihydrofolate reductase
MKRIIIVALTKDGKMGYQGKMPWKLAQELQLFKKITTGNTVIMGRKTYESIGFALPQRNNLVVTSSQLVTHEVVTSASFNEALEVAKKIGKNTFFIGGRQIYQQALAVADEIYISWIKKDYPADLYFPKINWNNWQKYYEHDFLDFVHSRYRRK